MENLVINQAHIFLTTIYGGIIIGFIYDIYRIFRYFLKPKKIATFIEDIIFWIIVSAISLLILFFSNWAELRWYIFLGFILGAFLYNKLLSKVIITGLITIVRYIYNIIKKVLYVLFYPLTIIFEYIRKPIDKIFIRSKKGYKIVKRYLNLPKAIANNYKKSIKNILRKK